MHFHVMTLFPEMIENAMHTSITGRALKKGTIQLSTYDIRDYTEDKNRRVDDYTYGGGAGMLMQAQPVYDCYQAVKGCISAQESVRTIYVTPQGRQFTQQMAEDFSRSENLVILCGHYEGVDERVLDAMDAEPVSIGDYVLTGGELPALVMMDTIARLVPGVLHNVDSADTESFHGQLLEYPQYTRPEIWNGVQVPQVLLDGNASDIKKWRLTESVKRTAKRRPDLYQAYARLQKVRNVLLQDKLTCMDMIDLLDAQDAILVARMESAVLLSDRTGERLYFANLDPESLSTEDFFLGLYQAGAKLPQRELVLHNAEDADCIQEIYDFTPQPEMFLIVYTQPVQLNHRRAEKYLAAYPRTDERIRHFLLEEINPVLQRGHTPYLYLPVSLREDAAHLSSLGVYESHHDLVKMLANDR